MVAMLTQLQKDDWELLHNMVRGVYLDGACYEFAAALHRGLGWPIFGIMADGTIRHAVVRVPGELPCWRDARGEVPDKLVRAPFGIADDALMREISEDDMRAVRPVTEHDIMMAQKFAQRLWPELPWKNPRDHNVLAFLLELEELSKKHGIWIRAAVPGARPVLEDAFGEEDGYIAYPTSEGLKYIFDRRLK